MNFYFIIFGLGIVLGLITGKYYFETTPKTISQTDLQKQKAFDTIREPLAKVKHAKIDEQNTSKIPSYITDDLSYYGIEKLTKKEWNLFIEHVKLDGYKENYSVLSAYGNSPFHELANSGSLHPKRVKTLIAMGFDINQPNNKGETPFLVALKSQNLRHIQILIENGANIHESSLEYALRNDNQYAKDELVSYLKEQGFSLENPELFSVLLNDGNEKYLDKHLLTANVNAIQNEAYSTFERIVMMKDNKYIEHYLNNGVNIATQSEGFNALHTSMLSTKISLENIQTIIDKGANINATVPKVNMTPLMYSIQSKTETPERILQKTELLLKNGADIHMTDYKDQNAYTYAYRIKNEALQKSMINLLDRYNK